MFSRLPESSPTRQRRAGGFTASTVVHAVLIALAVRATAWTAPAPARVEPLPKVVFLDPSQAPKPVAPAPSTPRDPGSAAVEPLPSAPPVIGVIDVIPNEIPPAGSMPDVLRGDEFRPSGGRITGDVNAGAPPNVASGEPLEERFVDRAIVAIPGTITPRYPVALQSAGIEGEVRARFVVDTLGRVEQGSVRILDSTHELFTRAVRDALARARFRPAEARGHTVRQLAEQPFTFRLADRR